jgi:cytochrome c-type biogenesis protein CcsB
MGALSDHLLVVTILAYLAAMLGYAAEYAFGARGAVARAVAVGELVGAGVAAGRTAPASAGPASARPVDAGLVDAAPGDAAPASDAPADVVAGSPGSPVYPVSPAPGWSAASGSAFARARTAERWGQFGVAATVLGALAHAATLVTRGFAAHRVPWGNMYEFVLTVCLVGVLAWFVLLAYRPLARHLGLFVTLALVVLLGIAGMNLYTKAGPLVPALNSYWLKIHVTAAATASGILLVGFVAAVMYLIRAGYEDGKVRFPYPLGARMPAAETLERLTFRIHAFAFPIWTLAIMCGAIWAEAAWGRYWGWDPKETWSFIAWVVYAGYLHARATPSVKRTVATWIAVLGWATMMVNLFGVNIVIVGLHSYAGVK